jgi:hypothetical protein
VIKSLPVRLSAEDYLDQVHPGTFNVSTFSLSPCLGDLCFCLQVSELLTTSFLDLKIKLVEILSHVIFPWLEGREQLQQLIQALLSHFIRSSARMQN